MKPIVADEYKINAKIAELKARTLGPDPNIVSEVEKIIQQVALNGDDAVIEYSRKFDCKDITSKNMYVTQDEIDKAKDLVDIDFISIINEAISNIVLFHEKQVQKSWFTTRDDGTILGQMVRPIEKAGLYVPGGRKGETPLISSVIMNALPAGIAGVKELIMVTPPKSDGSLDPHLLVTADMVGVNKIFKAGSAWAVAAMAYGTETIPKVDVIVGPGNIYVAYAKQIVSNIVRIDMVAGPSEILILADETANPVHIAADMLSQAEHDSAAAAILVCTDPKIASDTCIELDKQIQRLPRKNIAEKSINTNGAVFIVKNLDDALEIANDIAPEHLELLLKRPWDILAQIKNAGAIFIGDNSPESVGDYFAGPNHVLPTAGTARFSSALGVENFIKKSSIISYSPKGLKKDREKIMKMARLEGLEAHAHSVEIRFSDK